MTKILEVLKQPKVIATIVAVIVGLLAAISVEVKPIVQAICAEVAPIVDLKE